MSDLICERCKVRDCECVPYDVECDSCIRAYKQGGEEIVKTILRNVLYELERIKEGVVDIDEYIEQLKEEGAENE